MTENKIILSSQKELRNVQLLMRSNAEELGFLPMSRIEIKDTQGFLFHQYDSGEWLGYMVVGTIKPGWTTKIWQECIDKTARGYGSGKRLFLKLKIKCELAGVEKISLRCREGNEANLFWSAMGFRLEAVLNTQSADKRLINVYSMDLRRNQPIKKQPLIHCLEPIITTTRAKFYN